jgi:hypothetical protein
MFTPRVTELVRQGHVVTHPRRPREPFPTAPASAAIDLSVPHSAGK